MGVNQHSQLNCELEVLIVDEIGHRNIRTGKGTSLFEQMDVIGVGEIAQWVEHLGSTHSVLSM